MNPVIHQNELYNSETAADAAEVAVRRLRQIEELIKQSGDRPQRERSEPGRNLLTRAEALAELVREMSRGASAVITADGTGPALVAKVGAVALASATGAPLVPSG